MTYISKDNKNYTRIRINSAISNKNCYTDFLCVLNSTAAATEQGKCLDDWIQFWNNKFSGCFRECRRKTASCIMRVLSYRKECSQYINIILK